MMSQPLGGASTRIGIAVLLTLFIALTGIVVKVAPARAAFGFVPGSMTVESKEKDGSSDYRAGSHPYAFTIHVALKTSPTTERSEGGEMRDLILALPPGLGGEALTYP